LNNFNKILNIRRFQNRAHCLALFVYTLLLLFFSSQPIFAEVPFGIFATPLDGGTYMGEIQFTGWALDDVSVTSLKIYRNSVSGEGSSGQVYIGDAVFVEGARPDIAAAYPSYPNNTSAGWGYSFLSYFLPYGGNGTYTFTAVAEDGEGNIVTLGTKTITVENANNVKPFGSLDTPQNGATISGSNYLVMGWVLTPQPNTVPTDGSTITLYIDGSPLAENITYNMYSDDIATLFPGYNNSSGSDFYLYINTELFLNGIHTISVAVTDDAGNSNGIGSRYFSINNVVPVELTTFAAKENDGSILLTWQTATEINNFGFEIQRLQNDKSTKPHNWHSIGFVNGHGNSSSPKHYSFTDSAPPLGNLSYRLKQIDTDGGFEYSDIVEVEFSSAKEFKLSQNYPNPFNPTTMISYALPTESKVKIEIMNMIGQRVVVLVNGNKSAGYYEATWNAENLPSGIYFISISAEGIDSKKSFREVKKALLLK